MTAFIKMTASITIDRLDANEAAENLSGLGSVLLSCVEGGAGVGFVLPFTQEGAEEFWRSCLPGLEAQSHWLFVARSDGRILGTVMVIFAPQQNGQHRADIAKMLVHRDARGLGLSRQLMDAAENFARDRGKTLLVLDTVTGDTAEKVYPRFGFQKVGVIPDYAVSAHGTLDATTVFYKKI